MSNPVHIGNNIFSLLICRVSNPYQSSSSSDNLPTSGIVIESPKSYGSATVVAVGAGATHTQLLEPFDLSKQLQNTSHSTLNSVGQNQYNTNSITIHHYGPGAQESTSSSDESSSTKKRVKVKGNLHTSLRLELKRVIDF